LILLGNPKWGPIWWLAYYIPRLSRASLCVSWAFLSFFIFIFTRNLCGFDVLYLNTMETILVYAIQWPTRFVRHYYYVHVQESLANAKVSARQPWYIGRNSLNQPPLRIAQQYQRNLYIVEKYFQCARLPSLTMRIWDTFIRLDAN